jgi:hypothetical protein
VTIDFFRQELVYDAKDVTINTLAGKQYTCRTYQLPASEFLDEGPQNRPSPMYMDVIIKGATQNKLPESYINFLKAVETNELLDENLEIYKDILDMLDSSET